MPNYEVTLTVHSRVVVLGVDGVAKAISAANSAMKENGLVSTSSVTEIPDADLSHYKRHANIII